MHNIKIIPSSFTHNRLSTTSKPVTANRPK